MLLSILPRRLLNCFGKGANPFRLRPDSNPHLQPPRRNCRRMLAKLPPEERKKAREVVKNLIQTLQAKRRPNSP